MRVAVIGAGLAGLVAACELTDRGHRVTVYEKRPWAGGKTYSFVDPETGEAVDNGQHVFMGCTTEYVAFLRRLGTLGKTRRQRRLSVDVFDAEGRPTRLRAQGLPAPLHLAWSFARYRHLGLRERVRVGLLMEQVRRMEERERLALGTVSFGAWLRQRGQTETAVREFWDFLLVPTLNCRSDEASAAAALFVVREGFLASAESAAVGVPAGGLSELQVEPAVRYVEQGGGDVRLRAGVERIEVSAGRARGVATAEGTEACDAVVVAVPHSAVGGLLPSELAATEPFAGLADIPSAPIVNLHCWFDRPVAEFAFAAFVGNELQWVFNRSKIERETARGGRHHVVVSLSAAGEYMELTKRELEERFVPQLRAALPGAREAELVGFMAIKEPEATFVPAPGIARPGAVTPVENLFLAGAYTDTGWPATMESAVRSGIAAASALHVRSATFEPSGISL